MNTQSFIEEKGLRDSYVDRIEVLQKVKVLMLIPDMECATLKQIAEYYEVDYEVVKKCYQRNMTEINEDGVRYKYPRDFKNLKGTKCPLKNFKQLNGKATIEIGDGVTLVIPNRGLLTFSKRAIMRFGMLLRDSKIAQELRTQLLNIVESAKDVNPEILTKEIDEETNLQIELGKAVMSGNQEKIMSAYGNIMAYKNRHIDKLKEDNQLLAGSNLKWSDRKTLNRIINCMAYELHISIGETWSLLYTQLRYKFSIGLSNRKAADSHGKTKKLIDYIRPNEWIKVQMTTSSILEKNGISPTEFYENKVGKYQCANGESKNVKD